MSSFSTISSKATVAVATVVGEVINHIRRLSSSSDEEENPFQSEMHWRLPMLGIVVVVLAVALFVLNAIIHCIYPNQYDHQQSYFQPPPAQRIMPAMSIEPALHFTNGLTLAGGTDHPECTICLSEFVEGEKIRILSKCKHGFHDKCIETWLRSRTSCPTCRTSCVKTSIEKNPPENLQQQQQQQTDIDLEAANRPETEMMVLQQQQQPLNDVHIEIANQPETEMVVLQQQHHLSTE